MVPWRAHVWFGRLNIWYATLEMNFWTIYRFQESRLKRWMPFMATDLGFRPVARFNLVHHIHFCILHWSCLAKTLTRSVFLVACRVSSAGELVSFPFAVFFPRAAALIERLAGVAGSHHTGLGGSLPWVEGRRNNERRREKRTRKSACHGIPSQGFQTPNLFRTPSAFVAIHVWQSRLPCLSCLALRSRLYSTPR